MLNVQARPMNVLSTFRPMSDIEHQRLSFIQCFDFSKVRTRVLKDGLVSPDEVDEAIDEFRKFISLTALGYRSIAMMNPAVDEIWHTMIIHTKDYAELCEKGVGRFVHHQPATEDTPVSQNSKNIFMTAYVEVFGEFSPIWRIVAAGCDVNCNTNCSSCRSVPDCATTNCQDDDD